jgi:hypothetical protein
MKLEERHIARMADWRAWTHRGRRLMQYIEGDRGPQASGPFLPLPDLPPQAAGEGDGRGTLAVPGALRPSAAGAREGE